MKSIIFSTPMVQAILDGRKTQTRRVITSHTGNCPKLYSISYIFTEPLGAMYVGGIIRPRYQVKDVLWVRETWRIGAWDKDGLIAVDYKADGTARQEWIDVDDAERFERYWIESSEDAEKAGLTTDSDGEYHWEPKDAPTRWRSPIHMPPSAARIFLRVTDVRAERVQDISREDAHKEGFHNEDDYGAEVYFEDEWNNLNKKRGYGWETNPFVWVIQFERCEEEE